MIDVAAPDGAISSAPRLTVSVGGAEANARTPQVLIKLPHAADIVFVGRDEAQALWRTTDAKSIRGHC